MRLILLCAALAASNAALACADVRDVPVTPERAQQYEKQREQVVVQPAAKAPSRKCAG